MAVGMARVEVIDRNPVQFRPEVLLHLPHHVPREGPYVGKLRAVFRGDDEPELVAVLPPAFDERLAVHLVAGGAVQPSSLAVARGAVALQVPDVGVGRAAADLQSHDPRLDYDPTHPLARAAPAGCQLEPVSGCLATTDAGALSFPRPCLHAPPLSAHLAELDRPALGFGGRFHRL